MRLWTEFMQFLSSVVSVPKPSPSEQLRTELAADAVITEHLRAEVETEELRKRLASLRNPQTELALNDNGNHFEPMVWKGTGKALGEWLLRGYWDGAIAGESPRQAVRQNLKHFVIQPKNGAPVSPNADSIDSMLREQEKYRDPRPFRRNKLAE